MFKKTPPPESAINNNEDNEDKKDLYLKALKSTEQGLSFSLDDSSDPIAQAIDSLNKNIYDNMYGALQRTVNLSMHSSESLASISFLTGDVREVASSTQTIASAVEELNATSSTISQNSTAVVERSQEMRDSISSGHAAVETSVGSIDLIAKSMDTANIKIKNLSESVEAIVEILGTIERIAKQTNLLALNATIEAARAGEAGKGFAVVATEVKTLAGQTATATDDIREKINAISSGMDEVSNAMIESVGATDSGRSHVHKAGEEINSVVANIEVMTELMDSVAESVKEENQAIREIASNIDTINKKTAEAANNAEEASAVATRAAHVIDEQLKQYQSMNLPNSIFEFAKSDHIAWKKKLASMLVGQDSLTSNELSDHHQCNLGKWYDKIDDPDIKKSDAYIKMEKVHANVHIYGKKCAELFEKGDRVAAAEEYNKMSKESKYVLQYLNEIQKIATNK